MCPLSAIAVAIAAALNCVALQASEPVPASRADIVVPSDWIVLTGGWPSTPALARRDPIFARYLLDPNAPAPIAGEQALRADGTLHHWVLAPNSQSERSDNAWIQLQTGYAYSPLVVNEEGVMMARLLGAEKLFLNGEGFAGDPLGRGLQGVPVFLKKGVNHLFVTGSRKSFRLEFHRPEASLFVADWDLDYPVLCQRDLNEYAFADTKPLIINASNTMADFHLHYGDIGPDVPTFQPLVDEWDDGYELLPLTILKPVLWGRYDGSTVISKEHELKCLLLPIDVYLGAEHSRKDLSFPLSSCDDPLRATYKVENATWANAVRDARLDPHPKGLFRSVLEPPEFDLNEPVVFVVGTAGDEQEDQLLLARARFDAQMLWARFNILPTLIADEQTPHCGTYSPGYYTSNFVLYGNEDTNSRWREIVPPNLVRAKRGELFFEQTTYTGNHYLATICIQITSNDSHSMSIGLMADTGIAGQRLGYVIDPWNHLPEDDIFPAVFEPLILAPK